MQKIQQKVLDECVIVPIYQQEDIHCYTSDLQGFRNGCIPGSAAEVLLLLRKRFSGLRV